MFRELNFPENEIYAYYKSGGLFPCDLNIDLTSEADIKEFNSLCSDCIFKTMKDKIYKRKSSLSTMSVVMTSLFPYFTISFFYDISPYFCFTLSSFSSIGFCATAKNVTVAAA